MRFPRLIASHLQSLARSFPVVVLTGARQVGKTTLLRALFPEHNYVSLDLYSQAELAEQAPEEFLARHRPPLLIDEVQYAPKLFRHLQVFSSLA
jgi:predicted AAA+ superfamily ATPase